MAGRGRGAVTAGMSTHSVQELVSNERAHLNRLMQLVRDDPGDPEAQFFFAAWLARSGSVDEALDILNRLSRKRPHHPGIWLFKATLYEQLNDARKADACRMRAEHFLHPDGAEAPPPSPAQALATAFTSSEAKAPVRPRAKRKVALKGK